MADNPINNFPALTPILTDVLGHDATAGGRPTSKGTFEEVRGLTMSSSDTDDLSEGAINLYFTDTRARGALSGSEPIDYNSGTGTISFKFNSTNLKLTTGELNTIQDITTTSSPTFTGVTAGSGGNDVNISATGVLLSGTATVTKVIRFGVQDFVLGTPPNPSIGVLNLLAIFYVFDTGVDRKVYLTIEIPDDYEDGTDLTWHLLWSPSDGTAGNVGWEIHFEVIEPNNNETIGGAFTPLGTLSAAPGVTNELIRTPDVIMTGTTFKSGDLINLELLRIGASAFDTYGGDAQLSFFGLEYTANKLGK